MKRHLDPVLPLLATATLMTGCASSGYSPPEGAQLSEQCPVGEVWVCRNHYPSRIDQVNEEPMFCMCQYPQRIH